MCNIMIFKPYQMIERDKLWNCVYNNWHSYGLVTRVGDKLDIKRVVPESGEISPEEVYEALQKDLAYERYLHVRHNTAGATDLQNCHPFDVYFDEKSGQQVVFMHNGTMYEYKSQVYDEKQMKMVDDDSGASDTKNFVDRFLTPFVSSVDFGTGKGDVQHPMFVDLVKAKWPSHGGNRGLLISSKNGHQTFGSDWKEIGPIGDKFWSSNDSYFDKVLRGPEAERRRLREEEERKKKQVVVQRAKPATGDRKITPLKDVKINSKHDYQLSDNLKNVFNDWDVWTREGAASLGAATDAELRELYKDETVCVMLMDFVFTEFAGLYEEHKKLVDKHENASKLIATLKQNQKAA